MAENLPAGILLEYYRNILLTLH